MGATREQIKNAIMSILYDNQKWQAIADLKKWAEEAGATDRSETVEYILTAGLASLKTNNKHNEQPKSILDVKPIEKIVTKPGTLGEIFDTWIANGWTCENLIDPGHPYGQEKALEAIRGYNKRGATTAEMRDLREDQLSPQQLKYYSMFEDRYNKWYRTQK